MKPWIAIIGAGACAAVLMSGCDGSDSSGGSASSSAPSTATPPTSTTSTATAMSLDTAQILAQAREASETSEPYPVNDGAMTMTGTSDTSEPLAINGG
jgi:hypothetical protein